MAYRLRARYTEKRMERLWTYWLILSIAIPICLVLWLGIGQHGSSPDATEQHVEDDSEYRSITYEPAHVSDSKPIVWTAPNVCVQR